MRTFEEAYEGTAREIHERYIGNLAALRFFGVAAGLILIAAMIYAVLAEMMAAVILTLMLFAANCLYIIKKQKKLKSKDFIPRIIPALYDITREKMSINEINDSNLMRLKAGTALEYFGTLNADVDYHKFKVHDIKIAVNSKNPNGKTTIYYEGGLLISTPEEFPCRIKIEPDMKRELEAISLGLEANELQTDLINMNAELTSKMKNIMALMTPMEAEGPFRVYSDDKDRATRLVDAKYLGRLAEQKHKISIYMGHDRFYALIHDVHFVDESESIRVSYDRVYRIVKRLEVLLPFDRK